MRTLRKIQTILIIAVPTPPWLHIVLKAENSRAKLLVYAEPRAVSDMCNTVEGLTYVVVLISTHLRHDDLHRSVNTNQVSKHKTTESILFHSVIHVVAIIFM